ncbi:MAG TPA: DUF4012 domain-containing protein [Patescibacteria group bacterium]|nr:DUF4012 domain-containing protein [Patescibacteria group bacterium]
MDPANEPAWINETSALPIAHIDAQDERRVIALREYLESNGCQVAVNKHPDGTVSYHIAVGDYSFVKSIFSSEPDTAELRLSIVTGLFPPDAEKQSRAFGKIIVTDDEVFTPEDVVEIFAFFFAGNDAFYDKRRNVHEHAPVEANSGVGIEPPVTAEDVTQQVPVKKQESSRDGIAQLFENASDKDRIGTIISDVYKEDLGNDEPSQVAKKNKRRKRKLQKGIGFVMLFIFFMMVVPFIWYFVSVSATLASFAEESIQLKQSNTTIASELNVVGHYWLQQSRFSFGLVSAPFRILGFDDVVRGQERLISFLTDISSAFSDSFTIMKYGNSVATQVLSGNNSPNAGSPVYAMDQLRLTVESSTGTLGLAEAQLSTLMRDGTFPFSIGLISSAGAQALQSLATLRSVLSYVDQLLILYPQITGFRGQKTYLVLLQNSNELRPTGGFIGSVGLMHVEDGAVSDFTIQDVYAVDGQLKGHVDPPGPLKDLMNAEHWYLRDSNWNPDYFESATQSAWFYQKETGVTVDGVIALNVPVVVDLLKATGPIYLPDYNDRISADNFFGKSFYYTQHDFFPGSTQKSDFLGTLSRALLTTITSEKNINPILIFRAIATGLARKDILFMFTDAPVQQLVEYFGWAGRMFQTEGCSGVDKTFCVFDPFAAVEANVGVNKVNYFIKRSANRQIVIAPDGTVSESYSLTLRNTSNESNAGKTKGVGGAYLSYLRFYIAGDALVNDVTLDGQPVPSRDPKQKIAPRVPYIETTQAPEGARGIGVAFSIDPGVERTLRISYKRSTRLSFGRGGATLDLLYYKHPGVSDQNLSTVIQYPLYWGAQDESPRQEETVAGGFLSGSSQSPSLVAKEGQLEYNTTIVQDQSNRILFSK